MNSRYSRVAERAEHRCEYCQAPEAVFNLAFEIEHIVPPGRGGSEEESNLALSCRCCNLFKSDHLEGVDPRTANTVRLFHPREQRWNEHFSVDPASGTLMGLTPTGRAPVELLHMNRSTQVVARKQWMRLRFFPKF